jgi:hypothetical protein
MKRWLLHGALLAVAASIVAAVTWLDLSRMIPMRQPAGAIAAVFWVTFAAYAAITTSLIARKRESLSKVIAAHVIGAITAPAVSWLLAIAVFAAYKAAQHHGG